MAQRSYYDILGVSASTDAKDIRSAYKRIAAECHPDKARGDKGKVDRFKEATEAYKVLSDPKKRRIYDRGHAEVSTVEDLFLRTDAGRVLMEAMLPSAPAAKRRGMDLYMEVGVDAELLNAGGIITRSLTDPQGNVSDIPIEIPAGAVKRSWCRIPLFGQPGKNGAPNGDLLIRFQPVTQQRTKGNRR